MRLKFVSLLVSLAVTLWFVVPHAYADDWAFEVAPYLWVSGVDGEITANNTTYNTSASFSDILDQTKYGGSAIFSAAKGHWVSYAQLDYVAMEVDDIKTQRGPLQQTADLEMDSLLATVAGGYRFDFDEKYALDVMLGVRYAGLDQKVNVDGVLMGREINTNTDIYDALLVIRPRVQLSDRWYLQPLFSVGTGDSDLTWEVFPELIYQKGDMQFRFGYRNLNYDQKDGDDEIDISMRGALLGVGFLF